MTKLLTKIARFGRQEMKTLFWGCHCLVSFADAAWRLEACLIVSCIFYDIHQDFLRLWRSLVPTSHQSLCSFSPFPSRNRGWQPKVTGDSSTPSGGKSHHQYSRYLILWLVDTVTLLFVTLKPIPVPKRQMISLFQANGITFSGKWHHFFRQMTSLLQSCHKNWFSWEWTVSNTNLNTPC